MKVKCLYRLTPYGEIIESKYDTEVGLIDGVPDKMFHVVLDSSEWKTRNYEVYGDNYPVSNMEKFMFKRRDCYCCIEFNNLGYFALIDETAYIIVYDPDEPTPKYTLPKKQFDGKYVEIGLRPTKVRQLGIEPILYRLVFDTDTSKVMNILIALIHSAEYLFKKIMILFCELSSMYLSQIHLALLFQQCLVPLGK